MAMKHKSISTAHRVKETITNFDSDHIFTTQDILRLLNFGSRNAIDLILSRLVKENIIVRIARGVFVRNEANQDKITPFIVAEVKAKAFGKTIQLSGKCAAINVGIGIDPGSQENSTITLKKEVPTTRSKEATKSNLNQLESQQEETVYTFYTSGSSSSFQFGNSTIQFISASPRKRELPDNVSGMVLKAVWHLGRSNIVRSRVRARYIAFNQQNSNLQEFRSYIRTLPKWIVKNLYPAIA